MSEFLWVRYLAEAPVCTIVFEALHNVFPRHVIAGAGSAYHCSELLIAHFLIHEVPVVAFDVIDQHARPTRRCNSGFNPTHSVLGNDVRGVSKKIVVTEYHGYAMVIFSPPSMRPALVADRDLAVTAELMLCVATLWPTLDILRAT